MAVLKVPSGSGTVATKGVGLYENRARVICHLPLNNSRQERALGRVIKYLKEQRHEPIGVKGFTHSEFRPSSFHGFWWNPKRQKWVRDRIVLFIIDYKLDFSDERLSAKVEELKRVIRKSYRRYGNPQDEVWVVAEQVLRQD